MTTDKGIATDLTILVIDDEQDFLDSAKRGLMMSGFKKILLHSDPRDAVQYLEKGGRADIALLDISMPWMKGTELLKYIKEIDPSIECIMVTAINEARTAVDCLKSGAYDYLVKPFVREDLLASIIRVTEKRKMMGTLARAESEQPSPGIWSEAFKTIVTGSEKMIRILKEAELHARSEVPFLITGESGTGKELLAKAIHLASPRSRSPFLTVNMAALTGNLFDAEFFGHTRGAFTGAEKDRTGYLEATHRGTLFLDEIGDLPVEIQGKLLRVLQEGEFIKLGTSKTMKVDVRFITATNTDIDRLMARGDFRRDLYFRLKVARIHLPPLRERREDIPLLVRAFLKDTRSGAGVIEVEEDALSILMEYDYPGNVRELRSILQAAMNLSQGRRLTPKFLPAYLRKSRKTAPGVALPEGRPVISLSETEKSHIVKVYNETGANKMKTAKLLGIGLNTLRRKLLSYGID